MAVTQPTLPFPIRVVYMGTAALACPALRALANLPTVTVPAVVTQPDRPKGRKLHPQPSPVKETALSLDLPVLQPAKCRDASFQAELQALAPDLIVVAAYGQILPSSILNLPRFGCLNIHASLLPKYRGAAPIQWAILEGEPFTGVTLMKMDEGLDTGPMLVQEATPIKPEDDASSLHDRLAALGADLLLRHLPAYLAGNLLPQPQDEPRASYARKITKADGLIDWSAPALVVWNRIRAFTPWPGAYTHWVRGEERCLLKIWKAKPGPAPAGAAPGTVLKADSDTFLVACGEGALQIEGVQMEGGKKLATPAWLAGHRMPEKTRLG